MTEYKITDESKARAEAILKDRFPRGQGECLAAALDALCIPVDGWEPDTGKPHRSFCKGKYRLAYDPGGWRLFRVNGRFPIISTGPLMTSDKAKAWADAEIEKHEKKALSLVPGPKGLSETSYLAISPSAQASRSGILPSVSATVTCSLSPTRHRPQARPSYTRRHWPLT